VPTVHNRSHKTPLLDAVLNKLDLVRILKSYVRFQVLTTESMKLRAFWDIAPCSLVGVDRRFRGAYCLHHQGDESSPTPLRLHGAISQKALVFSYLSSLTVLISSFHLSRSSKLSLQLRFSHKYSVRIFCFSKDFVS
jgi:hypothetical protein